MNNKVSILMGSKSDLEIMKKAAEMLTQFGINYDINVLSAHRTPMKQSLLLKHHLVMFLLLELEVLHIYLASLLV